MADSVESFVADLAHELPGALVNQLRHAFPLRVTGQG